MTYEADSNPGGSDLTQSWEEGEALALQEGLTIVYSTVDPVRLVTTLLLDIDCDHCRHQLAVGLSLMQNFLQARILRRWWSRQGRPHEHVVVEVGKVLSVPERLLLQVCLGSDIQKEFLSLLRLYQGIENPIRLFAPADAFKDPPDPTWLSNDAPANGPVEEEGSDLPF